MTSKPNQLTESEETILKDLDQEKDTQEWDNSLSGDEWGNEKDLVELTDEELKQLEENDVVWEDLDEDPKSGMVSYESDSVLYSKVTLKTTNDGNFILPFSKSIVDRLGWKSGDTVVLEETEVCEDWGEHKGYLVTLEKNVPTLIPPKKSVV
jgi:hypothetical protein